jgi:transposase
VIKETEKEIKNLLKQSIPFIGQSLRVLLILKQNEKEGISKREVSKLVGVDPNSVQNWRTLYLNSGIDGLLKHQKKGFKPSVFNAIEHNICWKQNSTTLKMDFKAMLSLKIGLKRNLERLSITTPYFITASGILNQV